MFNSINKMQHFAAINQKQLLVKASCDIAVANYSLLQAGEMGTKHPQGLKVWQTLPSTKGYENTNTSAALSLNILTDINGRHFSNI